MFNINRLLDTNQHVRFTVPAKSRHQTYAAYTFNGTDEDLTAFDQDCQYHYYITTNPTSNSKRQKIVIVIPFENELNQEQFDSFNPDFISPEIFTKIDNGAGYRGSKQTFIEKHKSKENMDGIQYTQDSSSFHYDINKITKALKKLVNSPSFTKISNDDLKRRRFLLSLAADANSQIYTLDDMKKIIKILQKHIKDLKNEYNIVYKEISSNNTLCENNKGFAGRYLQTYLKVDKGTNTLGQYFRQQMDPNVVPSPNIKLNIAGGQIQNFFPPYLINEDGPDIDKVVIFDPLTGTWVHNKDVFNSLLNMIKPYSSGSDLQTLMSTFATIARNKGDIIDAYSGSRYLVFKNCVVDLKVIYQALQNGQTLDELDGKERLELSSEKVRQLHFTERAQLDINYNPKVVDSPQFEGMLAHDDGKDRIWDPQTFFMAYAEENHEKYKYLLFGLSLGLFGGHNFGVHFDIKGESRWGKTTLSKIFQNLYPNRVQQEVYSKLNEQFGLTNYQRNTSVVWLRECNVGSAPLNSTYGTQIYDEFGDDSVSIQVKGNNDLIIKNPPQVFIDGTTYVSADNMDTGPAGRTLVYKLPMENDPDLIKKNLTLTDLTHKAYSSDIHTCLRNETVLQYLVNEMIKAYLTTLKLPYNTDDNNRLWSLKLNLGGRNQDVNLLPDFAKKWRKEMSETAGELKEWFDEEFKPYVSGDKNNRTKMHDTLAYNLYLESYRTKHGQQDPTNRFALGQKSFTTQLHKLYDDADFVQTVLHANTSHPGRAQISTFAGTNFEVQEYSRFYVIPSIYTDEAVENYKKHRTSSGANSSYPLGIRSFHWYEIYDPNKKDDDK